MSDSPEKVDPTQGGDLAQVEKASPQHNKEAYQTQDPIKVDFDGPDDPANPMNWPSSKKVLSIALVSTMVMLSHIGSTISSAAIPTILQHFNSTNQTIGTLITTIYLLGYASGPLVIAPLSELYGRAIVYKTCSVLFVLFNISCAVANSLPALVVLRLLAGVAASTPVTLGPGSIADMVPSEKRAGPMSAFVVGAVMGPVFGPICAGYLTPAAGWRWPFWLMAIASAVMAVLFLTLMQESYPYAILERKAKQLRKETGDPTLHSILATDKPPREFFILSIVRPMKMLLSPIVFVLSLYNAVVYSYLYLCFATFPRVFGDQYDFNSGQAGLATLGLGIGGLAGVLFCASVTKRLSNFLSARHGGGEAALPEYRLLIMTAGGICNPIGLFWYGWTAEYQTHWLSPIAATGFINAGMIIIYMSSTMYLIEVFPVHAASVTAASTVLRCSSGALLPLAGSAMYDALGIGWGTSALGFISVAFVPVPVGIYWFGKRIRGTSSS